MSSSRPESITTFIKQQALLLQKRHPDLFPDKKIEDVVEEVTDFFYSISRIMKENSKKTITLDELQELVSGPDSDSDKTFISCLLDSTLFMRQIDAKPTYEFVNPSYYHFFISTYQDDDERKQAPRECSPPTAQPIVALLGDMDNKPWIGRGGYLWYRLKEWLGIARDGLKARLAQAKRAYFKTELTIVENTIDVLSGHHTVKDYAQHGCTTAQMAKELKEKKDEMKKGPAPACIVLSIGGNNFKNFLKEVRRARDRKAYITENYSALVKTMVEEYCQIVETLRKKNPLAKIILLTHYYPFAVSTFGPFYPLIQEIGRALNIGQGPNNAMDVIHAIMKEVYTAIFEKIEASSVVVADVTSSLDPFDSNNHSTQMAPSGEGGRKIAQMLNYIIPQTLDSGNVYRFLPGFFTNSTKGEQVETCSLQTWRPKHPYEFTGAACYDARAAVRSLEKQGGALTEEEYSAIDKDENLRRALIVLQQITDCSPAGAPSLITRNNFRSLLAHDRLKNAVAAAHAYLNSGHFGWFRTHHNSGIADTMDYVRDLMKESSPDDEATLLTYVKYWLINSGVNNSSRMAYASRFGLLSGYDNQIAKNYATATRAERQALKNRIFARGN